MGGKENTSYTRTLVLPDSHPFKQQQEQKAGHQVNVILRRKNKTQLGILYITKQPKMCELPNEPTHTASYTATPSGLGAKEGGPTAS